MYSSTSISADHARTGPTGTSFVSGEPSSAFQTPMSSCRSGAMLTAGQLNGKGLGFFGVFVAASAFASTSDAAADTDAWGAAETMSAKLLLSAQQKLQQAFPCGVAPHSLTTLSTITQQPCQHGVIMPKMSSLDATSDICDFMLHLEPHGENNEPIVESSDQPGACEEIGDSDEESVSSMSNRRARKRRCRAQPEACANCNQRAGEAAAIPPENAADQQQLRCLCDDLVAQNAVLRSQLASAAEALRCERASFQAELHALRQKNVALGAFLPQSVAAFASEVPSSMYTKKGLRAMLD